MKVSVITTCYNGEKTVGRALDSVLAQKTTFDYEVIVLDDGSTDDSVEVLRQYDKHNTNLRAYWRNANRGIMQTYLSGFESCHGEYIAFCEHDDYWIDKSKLQKQADYMDSHPECGLCTHRVATETNGKYVAYSPRPDEVNGFISFDSLLKGSLPIYAQSYCIRKSVFDKYVDFDGFCRKGFNVFDLPIVLELIRRTTFFQLNYFGAVFTKDGESITNTKKRAKRLMLILGYMKIKLYYIFRYGCKPSTVIYVFYKFTRDLLSVCFHRWDKHNKTET